ncbi:MAG: autotransporter-associated beta strand repeat-containing protein [Prevotella sp.]|nr:autotransporter-associated beta strand repeat-containing protein [Prevotella sp.]
MKRLVTIFVILLLVSLSATAQRKMDNLGRGLVAVKLADNGNSIGTLISWRRLGTEYYDVTYNLYYNGSLLAQNLNNTNYAHGHSITGEETYQVAAVVNGIEQERCNAVTVWPGWQMYRNGDRYVGGYMDIPLGEIYSRSNQPVTDSYWANDIEVADLDGDGEMEFIIKRMNIDDANALYVDMTDPAYDVIEAYEFDGTRLWWIDVGANMVSGNSTETNVIAFDWDEDGAAEVVLRGADDMVIHYMENGIEKYQNIGTYGLSTRNTVYHAANGTYTNTGNEYLIYLNGTTGKPYNIGNNNEPWMTYPLPRLENGESSVPDAWWYSAQYTGTGKDGILGHRDSKYFMGAPYLDGRHPSLYLGRGIYTRHKMIALDLNKQSHKWITRWQWNCNDRNSPWFGNGYHNFLIADVDEDGRDEIVYGSMVIDDNGKGLHTTGYQHGDAQHVGDFNPWRKGLEFFGCLEDAPYYGSNYRDATTGEVLYKFTSTGDDGRALMANFSNNYPGCLGRSSGGGEISSVTGTLINGLTESLDAGRLNFRIYWDGDLLSEWQDASGTRNGYITINKPGRGRIFNAANTMKDENNTTVYYNTAISNNDTKNNTCFQGDIIGDWREEFIARVDSRTIRLYTSGVYSDFSFPSLWYDHQYRQAMATQQMVYNLPPHLSFFLGEMEGYTQAPPPQTTNERTEITNGGTINSNMNGKQVIACETNDMTINVTEGVSPWVFTDNAPSKVEGTDYNGTSGTKVRTDGSIGVANPPAINRTYYTHTVTGGAFTGAMHLTKQGDGTLILPNVTETYSGETTVWAGTLEFNGTMQNSKVAMKRFTTLNTSGGSFSNGMTMQYGATLNVGGPNTNTLSSVNISELTLEYGARVVLDVNGNGENQHDWLNATTLNIDDSKTGIDVWKNYGPKYIVPVFKLDMSSPLGNGRYPIGNVTTVNGDLSKVKIECDAVDARYLSLIQEGGVLYLKISDEAIANEANIEITGMAPYENVSTPYPSASSDNYYLPIVSIIANNTNGQVPTLSGTFTSLDGTVTNIGSNGDVVLFSENFESETVISEWTHSGAPISLGSGDDGNYFLIDLGSTSTRYAYKRFSSVDVSNGCGYSIEFDLALKAGNTDPGEFCVMSKGGTNPTNYWDNYASINNNANLLFDLEGSKNSTVYNVNGTTTTTLASETWYHISLNVNQNARTVAWQISNGSSGTFELPAGTSTEFDGFYFVTGRYNSKAMLDNIVIKSAGDDLSSFTFPEPGTLQVTSAVEGYSSGIKTFEVKYPYYKLYGKDFDQITSANIAEVLGNNWNTTAQNTRWAFWSKNNSTYGENYQAYWVVNNTSPIYLCNDSDPKVVWMDSNSSYKAAVMESFGVGRNSNGAGATIHVQNSGDSNTLIYYLVDNSQGNSPSTYGGYDKADSDGSYTIAMSANYTLAKLYIYVPVSIHDELATVLPQSLDASGNAHVWRKGLSGASPWATMVVPFDLTADQAKELFGENVVIGNFVESSAMSARFETTSGEVHANQPFLIKNVTKDAPYLVMGITSTPYTTPIFTTTYFDFIGRYTDGGNVYFNTDDYFFNANTGKLSTVNNDGTTITMKGYRAYFHARNSQGNAKEISLVFDDEPINGIATDITAPSAANNQQVIYNLQGQRMNNNAHRRQLQRGVYIVNDKKVVVK